METLHPDGRQTLSDLARHLRDLVNHVRLHERLWRGPKRNWHIVTSGLDMVQDTAWALETYVTETDDLYEDKPHAYIRIFGVLNGQVIQQDAAFLLFKGVGVPESVVEFKRSSAWASSIPSLAKARHIRVAGGGHPVEWGEKKSGYASTFIGQHSVNSRGCRLMLRHHDGTIEWQHVSLKALIEAQHETLAEQCRMAIAELKADGEGKQEESP